MMIIVRPWAIREIFALTIASLSASRALVASSRIRMDGSTIRARVLAINSQDDERNPAELGLTAAAVKRLKDARYYEIPASTDTRGHGTTGSAHWFEAELKRFLDGR